MNTKNCLFNYDIIENNNNEGGEIMNNNKLVVNLGADTTSRLNGTVGGEMTRRLVKLGEEYYGKQTR